MIHISKFSKDYKLTSFRLTYLHLGDFKLVVEIIFQGQLDPQHSQNKYLR